MTNDEIPNDERNPKLEIRSGAKRATFGTKSKMAPEAPQIRMTEIQNSKRRTSLGVLNIGIFPF
jgi:hypothetical protein